MIIGILSLQGSFIEHKTILDKLKIDTILVKDYTDIEDLDGLILPGGESTSMSIINETIFNKIKKHISIGKPIWGTCAGLILLSNKYINSNNNKQIGGLSIEIQKNFFGSQLNSFSEKIKYPSIFSKKGDFTAIFIRAPIIKTYKDNVNILCKNREGHIVAIQEGNILGTSFHPELTNDTSWHEYFIFLVKEYLYKQ